MSLRRATLLILILAADLALIRWSFASQAVGAELLRRPRGVYSCVVMLNLLAYAGFRLIHSQGTERRFWTGFLVMGTLTVATCAVFFALARLDQVVAVAQALDQIFLLIPGARWLLTNNKSLGMGQIPLATAGAATMALICALPQLYLATLAGWIITKARITERASLDENG